jgi:hypothetical protein
MDIVMNVVNFVKGHLVEIGLIALVVQNFVKGLRDALDKTPDTDDNIFEKIASVSVKLLNYLVGIRAK